MVESAVKLGFAHPLMGEGVTIRQGAVPAGWDRDMEDFDEPTPVYATVTDVFGAEEGFPFGTVEAGGWAWDMKDVMLR